jgi:single-strand DNA-binding protein
MSNINKVILLGNLTRVPEVAFTNGGTAFVDLGLAVNDRWKGRDGEMKEETCFVECRAWGKQAESAGRMLVKGQQVLIEGKLKQERWEDKTTGKQRSKTLVVVEHWQFVGRKPEGARGAAEQEKEGDPW